MHALDYVVLGGYFLGMIGIGVYCSRRINAQEDFFMGGRGFGKLLQTFAAFGAGTGSSDPVNTGRTTFTSGMSGMWSVMYWLFVTPFYWITGVWYRRMRHLTLGDWFVERYESRAMGAAYCVFGLAFFMVYGSMLFSAIGKVAAPLVQIDTVAIGSAEYGIEYVLVPVIGVVVLVYGIAGGLSAAYFTDLVQGMCIILLSIILIPFGLEALVQKFGDPASDGLLSGFRIMHEQLPPEYFDVVGSGGGSQFPIGMIVAVVLINLVGIVVQPHFIATGGGSAKTEMDARVGLVVGNFLKRFCTVGWVLTALIAVALFSDHPELVADPDRTWGVASRELLGPGLTGLMLACLLAALMSTVDAQMVVGSALVVRNIYAPYFNPGATERQYILVARITGGIIVLGAVLISLFIMDVLEQLKLTWVFPVLFAAPFWIGIAWRRATTAGAWCAVTWCLLMFFLVPFFAPRLFPTLRSNSNYLVTNELVETTSVRSAAPADVARRSAQIAAWDAAEVQIGERPEPLRPGDPVETVVRTGGTSVFWGDGVVPVSADGTVLTDVTPQPFGDREQVDESTTRQVLRYPEGVQLQGMGSFKLDLLLYQWAGVDLTDCTSSTLETLGFPPKIVAPFLVIILVSLCTPRNSKAALDRYYAKMKTPVDPDPAVDAGNLERAWADPEALESRKLFPGSSIECLRPNRTDVMGFVISLLACFGIIGLAMWVAGIGG